MRILLIDDDAAFLGVLALILKEVGFTVDSTTSAQEGLKLAWENHPKLIISDIRMPDFDGTSILRALRTDEATASTKVILMTGYASPELKASKGRELGADGFLEKPFSTERLLEMIKTLCPGETIEDLRKSS